MPSEPPPPYPLPLSLLCRDKGRGRNSHPYHPGLGPWAICGRPPGAKGKDLIHSMCRAGQSGAGSLYSNEAVFILTSNSPLPDKSELGTHANRKEEGRKRLSSLHGCLPPQPLPQFRCAVPREGSPALRSFPIPARKVMIDESETGASANLGNLRPCS